MPAPAGPSEPRPECPRLYGTGSECRAARHCFCCRRAGYTPTSWRFISRSADGDACCKRFSCAAGLDGPGRGGVACPFLECRLSGRRHRRRRPRATVRRISIDEAVALALENNLDLQVERINPQMQDLTVGAGQDQLHADVPDQHQLERPDPAACLAAGRQRQPAGGQQRPIQLRLRRPQQVGRQLQPRAGTTPGPRRTTSSRTSTRRLAANISASYTQPLLRNFKIDGTRQQLLVIAEEPRDLGRPGAAVDRAHLRATSRTPTTT